MPDYLDKNLDWTHPAFVAIYDELPLWSAIFGHLLLEHIQIRPHLRVLDVGCGTGFPLLELAQRLGATCQVYGIDPWEAALNRVRQKAELLDIRNVEVRQGDAAAMPFQDGTFDLIVSNLGINNFENAAAALAECSRVAKPGARIALTTNLRGHMDEFYEVFETSLQELGKTAALDRLTKHIHHRTTLEETSQLLEGAGFEVARIHRDSFSMRFVDGSTMLRHSFIRIGFLDAWREVAGASDEREVFARIEENLNRLAGQQGELRLTIPTAYIEGEKRS
mgnify:CR=1 FL=1